MGESRSSLALNLLHILVVSLGLSLECGIRKLNYSLTNQSYPIPDPCILPSMLKELLDQEVVLTHPPTLHSPFNHSSNLDDFYLLNISLIVLSNKKMKAI